MNTVIISLLSFPGIFFTPFLFTNISLPFKSHGLNIFEKCLKLTAIWETIASESKFLLLKIYLLFSGDTKCHSPHCVTAPQSTNSFCFISLALLSVFPCFILRMKPQNSISSNQFVNCTERFLNLCIYTRLL